jgi:outer membrane protein assembly factor BamD (BamD/ComL family)
MIRNERFLPFIVLFLLIPAFLMAQDPGQTENEEILFAKGFDLFKQGMYVESAEAFHAIAAKEGNNNLGVEAAYLEVIARIDAVDLEKAQVLTDAFLAKNPDNEHSIDLLYQRGRIAFLYGDYEEAISRFTHFTQEQRGSQLLPSALFWRAESLYLLGRTKDAFEELTLLVKNYPDSSKRGLAEWRLEVIGLESREGVLKRVVDFNKAKSLQGQEDEAYADSRKERDLEREHLLVMNLRSLYGFAGSWRTPLYAERTIVAVAAPAVAQPVVETPVQAPVQPDPLIAQAALEMSKANRLKELLGAKNAALELLANTLLAFAEELSK